MTFFQAALKRHLGKFNLQTHWPASQETTFAKVYGERNTGTNFLRLLLAKNTTLQMLGDGNRERSKERLRLIRSSYSNLSDTALKVLAEQLLDSDREASFLSHLGWKHGCPNSLQLKRSPIFKNTLFFCLVRNPWSFVLSLHKRPYNIIPYEKSSLQEFIDRPIIANTRDNLQDNWLKSPVELWNRKVASYFRLKRDLPGRTFIIFYEDIVLDPAKLIKDLNPFTRRIEAERLCIPQASTKAHRGAKRSYTDYKRLILEFDPTKALGTNAFKSVKGYLDCNLLRNTPYLDFFGNPDV